MEALGKYSTLSYISSLCLILSLLYIALSPDHSNKVHPNTCAITICWTVREPLAECEASHSTLTV